MKGLLVVYGIILSSVFAEDDDSDLKVGGALDEAVNDFATEISKEQLEGLNKKGTLDLTKAFRCGLFMTWPKDEDATEEEKKKKEKPVSPLFIFNATFDATKECEAGKPNLDRYVKFCSSAWDKGLAKRGITLDSPSIDPKRAAKGIKVLDDICGYMKKFVKTPFVGKHSRKFPDGLEFGMFTNACGGSGWEWAGRTHPERVCCRRGRGAACPEGIM